jgi:nicotinate-nucleotide pyrophosphorylase
MLLGRESMRRNGHIRIAGITLEALDLETASLIKETHFQIAAAHRAAIKDLRQRFDGIEHSNRLTDKWVIEA